MTRINVIEPFLLSDKHLGAEYRELPRIFGAVRTLSSKNVLPSSMEIPSTYRLRKGHVTFFYDKLSYLTKRYLALCHECRLRGRVVNYGDVNNLTKDIAICWFNDWLPTSEAIALNLARIEERGGLRSMQRILRSQLNERINNDQD